MTEKPIFIADVSPNATSSLEVHKILCAKENNKYFHIEQNLRLPLGIYNISVARVVNKLLRLCEFLEDYIKKGDSISALNHYEVSMGKIIDYIELALYASAEHIDDIYSIANGYFQTKAKAKKSLNYKKLDREIKQHKKLISTIANEIKHNQSRIRMFSVEYRVDNTHGCLHGYFIESVERGVICPSRKIHSEQDVFSITTLIWEIIYLLLNCSRSLAEFISKTFPEIQNGTDVDFSPFAKAVIAAARLPLYSFGEVHPFNRATLKIESIDNNFEALDSGVYGSIFNEWSKTVKPHFDGSISRFEGDSVSKSFRLAEPKFVSLHYWG